MLVDLEHPTEEQRAYIVDRMLRVMAEILGDQRGTKITITLEE